MTDRHENAPPPADWSPEPRAWDEAMCCPTDCAGVCEIGANVTLGEN